MNTLLNGKAWVFADNIDTDVLAPGAYMKGSIAELAAHCLEAVHPSFAREVKPGDIMLAGDAFGIGSSREQAAQALVELGVAAVVARSFARIFYRNALNLGLPVLFCPTLEGVQEGDNVSVDLVQGLVINHTRGQQFSCEAIPPQLMAILAAGGLMPYLKARFSKSE